MKKITIKKTDKILLAVMMGTCSAIIASEMIDDFILTRIWYVIGGIVCGIIVYIWMMDYKSPKKQFSSEMKNGDVTDIIIKRDLIKRIDEISTHIGKIDEMSTHIGKIDEDLQSIQSLMMSNIADVLDEDSRERMSVASGQVQRIRPNFAPIIGAKPLRISRQTPTTVHEEIVTSVKPSMVIPRIKPIVPATVDISNVLSPEESARLDAMVVKPMKSVKPAVTLVKPVAPQNIDHYDGADDADSEE